MASNVSVLKTLHIPSTVKSLPPKWIWRRLDDICLSIIDCPHSTPEITSDGPLMVRTQDILSGVFQTKNAAHVSVETYHERTRRGEPLFGDLLYSREGTYFGNAAEVPSNVQVCLGQRMVLIKPNPEIIYFRFLRYWLNSSLLLTHVKGQRDGTVAERLNLPTIRGLPIPTPPLSEQCEIADVLYPLEDKIELNRQMNETLEAIAKAIFKSWFVDFDPVRAKMEGRKPYGMDEEIAGLFPTGFTDSILGYIPLGWKVVCLADTCKRIFSGGTPSTQITKYWNGNIPWLSSGETRNRFIIDTEKTITKEGIANSSTRLARSGCTVIAGAGQGHTRGQTSLLMLNSYINQSVVALEANPEISSDFFLFFDLIRRYEEFRQLSDSHSSRGSLTTKLLSDVKMVLPPAVLIQNFDDMVRPIVAEIVVNLHNSYTLASIRDTLLPKLLSGEIRVSDAEKMAEANL